MRVSLKLGLLIAVVALYVNPLASQGALPARLVQQGDLVYQGSFNMPTSAANDFDYAVGVIAFNAARNSLFVVGNQPNGGKVAEVSIPTLGGTATLLQPFRDALEGKIGLVNPGDPNGFRIGGMTVIGDRLVIAANAYYDGSGTATTSHFVRSTSLTTSGVVGPFRVGSQPVGMIAGYFAPIPAAWQSPLGGSLLNGECCLNIISRSSYGPAVSAVLPSTLLAGVTGPATALLGYPSEHPLEQYAASGIHTLWNGATKINGVALPDGTASVLFFGMQGLGPWCYGDTVDNGGSCPSDDINPYKGAHAPPYQGQVWAYDANELAAVKAGAKQMWEVRPYTTWGLPDIPSKMIGGVAVDATSGRIYVADTPVRGGAMTIKVYAVSGATGTADTVAPAVALTSPAPGLTLTGATTLTATASDNVGVASVWFTVDGATVGSEVATSPFQQTWNPTGLSPGLHVIRAMARDAAGNIGTSTAVSITLSSLLPDLLAPTVAVSSPASGSTVSGSVTLTATATDNVGVAGVRFTVDGTNVGSEDTTAPYTYSWLTSNSTNGTRLIRAIARDTAGNVTTSSTVTVTVANAPQDTTMPTVSVTAPTSGTTLSGTVTVTAAATDNTAIAGVQFTLDGSNLGSEDTTAPYSVNWTTTSATNGGHSLRAVARDTAGNKSTSGSVVVTVNNTGGDTTAPTVSLTAPANGSTVSRTTTISASASDNIGVAGVQFTLDGANIAAEDTVAPYSLSWNTTGASNGSHTLRAIARDAAGNTRLSSTRTVTVNNLVSDVSAPTVNLTSPAANAKIAGSVTLSATATDDVGVVGVQFSVDGVNVGAEDTSAPYTRMWTAGTELNGAHTISATARDAAGNRRTSTVDVILRNLGSGVGGDMNDDGTPDLVFEHTNGQLYTWLMTNSTMTGGKALSPAAVNPVWRVVSLDDFDGDKKTDILWQNSVTGEVYLWMMDQGALIDEASLSGATPWRVMGTADLNGDGKPDILWKEPTSGQLAFWYMNGSVFISSGVLASGQINPNWRLAGTADINKDGKPDFIWQNRATGELVYWQMNGAALVRSVSFVPGATDVLWEVRAVADLDRDGNIDLVFQHAITGQLYVWYLNGAALVRSDFLSPSQVDPNWRVVGGK